MNMISNNIDINKLTILLKKFNTKFRYRNGASKNISNYDIVRIVNVYTKVCRYTGGQSTLKPHLVIKYIEKQQDGIICLSIPFDHYSDLL